MLKFFRDQKDSWLVKSILILTALSFISLFGADRLSEKIPDEGKAIVSVAGKKITVAEYIYELEQKARSISKMTQQPFTMKNIVESGMLMPQLNQMVSRLIMEATADNLRLTVNESYVRDIVKNMPMFAGVDGNFSLTAYKKYLSDMGLSEKRFISDSFLDLKTQQLFAAAGTLSIAPKKTAEADYGLQNEKRSVDVFTITPSKLKIDAKPSEKEKEELYKEMSENLVAPEYRSFTVMYLTLDDVSKKINLTEAELEEAFNENKEAYSPIYFKSSMKCMEAYCCATVHGNTIG